MSIKEKVLEGKYNYFNNDQSYSEENFRVEREGGRQGNLIFHSEVLSRVRTGEFLKAYIEYEVTQKSFDPVNVKVTRQLGAKESVENFHFNHKTKNVTYIFESAGKTKYFEKVITSTPHVGVPCFLTSMLMVNQKKIDPVQRTPYTIITSNNIWSYESKFKEKEVYVELQELEPTNLVIEGNELKATHCKLLQVDERGTIVDVDHNIYLSKHFYIPYVATFGNGLKIQVEIMKNYESRASNV